MNNNSYRLALIDKYSDEDTAYREFSLESQLSLFCKGNKTAKLELIIYNKNFGETLSNFKRQIPGPHICNLSVFKNPVWIFLCMTMGYFRDDLTETNFCIEVQKHLKRNKQEDTR